MRNLFHLAANSDILCCKFRVESLKHEVINSYNASLGECWLCIVPIKVAIPILDYAI